MNCVAHSRRLVLASLLAGGLEAQCTHQWLGLDTNAPVRAAVALPNGDVVVGGSFTTIGGSALQYVARSSQGTWVPIGGGLNGGVYALAASPNGDLIAGGVFPGGIARWNGSAWASLGGGVSGSVVALAFAPNGDLVVGGSFAMAGGTPANSIARWNGVAWSPLGAGAALFVYALAAMPNGDVIVSDANSVAGGPGRIRRWDGSAWTELAIVPFGFGYAMLVRPDGTLVVGGQFDSVHGVAASNIATWDGTTWSSLGSGTFHGVLALANLPGGDLAVGGKLPGSLGVASHGLERWNGSAWSSYGGQVPIDVRALAVDPRGELIVGAARSKGTAVGSLPRLERLMTSCPATATAFGNGCVGSGGANTLTAVELPWLGGAYRGRATGMPALGVAVTVSGFTQVAVPLSLVFAEALPGCIGHTTPDLLELAVPVAGVVETRIDVPLHPALVGAGCHQYVLPFEVDAAGQLVAVTATNGITLTVGSF